MRNGHPRPHLPIGAITWTQRVRAPVGQPIPNTTPLNRPMFLPTILLFLSAALIKAACPVAQDAAKLLVKNICLAMTENDLATMNGAICASNSTLQYSYGVDGVNPCVILTAPYAQALPLVLRTAPQCVSMIPYFSYVETINGIDVITVLAYSESIVMGVRAIHRNVLKFSSPVNDCNIKLDSQSYVDVRCFETLS